MPKLETRTQQELADRVGCTQRAVSHAIRSGRLPRCFVVQRGRTFRLRSDSFAEAVAAMTDIYGFNPRSADRQRRVPASASAAFAAARARREFFQAEKARLELERFEATHLPTEAVVTWYTALSARLSEAVLALPGRLAPDLVGLDAGTIAERLDEAVRGALRELRSELEAEPMGIDQPDVLRV